MASFVFNNFKKRYLKGQISNNDIWHFIPVNSQFKETFEHDNIKLEYYRNIYDFSISHPETFYIDSGINNLSGKGFFEGNKINRTWSKVIDDNNLENKPFFIKGSNFNKFKQIYGNIISSNSSINSYISENQGFYFICSKDELTWFANRANSGNNRIIGVLGDNIEGIINSDPIGKNEKYPFQGILDGNGFALKNISIQCNNTDNGIVGILGTSGVVKNFNIVNDIDVNVINLNCSKSINLQHIKEDARDINAGILVGRNYGTIKNIKGLNLKNFKFSGFVPEVYSVTNKSDNYSWRDGLVRKKFDNSNENFYLLNSFCINSPGNICPYIGYFAEGYYGEDKWRALSLLFRNNTDNTAKTVTAKIPDLVYYIKDDNDYLIADANSSNNIISAFEKFSNVDYSENYYRLLNNNVNRIGAIGNDDNNIIKINNNGNLEGFYYWTLNENNYSVNNNYYSLGSTFGNISNYNKSTNSSILYNENDRTIYNMVLKRSKYPVYYGLDANGFYTCGLLNGTDKPYTSALSINYNTNIIAKSIGIDESTYTPTAYIQTSMRMQSLGRVAYNVGIIAGENQGTIQNIAIKTTAINEGNFVGFIGGIAGKQGIGKIKSVSVDLYNKFIYDGIDNSYNVIYKGTPILPQTLRNSFTNYQKTYNSDVETCNLDYYFSAFYEGEDSTVNTATTITDDCVTYKLRPIFIAGGLFGRYVPTNLSSSNGFIEKQNCLVESVNVTYSDNYEETNNLSGNFKRIENAIGIIAGKIDFGVENLGTNLNDIHDAGLKVLNSNFMAKTKIGPSFSFLPRELITNENINESYHEGLSIGTYDFIWDFDSSGNPIKTHVTTNTSRYIGIYELSYDILNSVQLISYNNAYFSANSSISSQSANQDFSGKNSNILFTNDLPLITNSKLGDVFAAGFFAKHYNSAGLGIDTTYGFNKRNIATQLLSLTNCNTNIDPVILLYDNYFNDWTPINGKEYSAASAKVLYNTNNISEFLSARIFANDYHSRKFNFKENSATDSSITGADYRDAEIVLNRSVVKYIDDEFPKSGAYNRGISDDKKMLGIQESLGGYTFISGNNVPAWDKMVNIEGYSTNSAWIDGSTNYSGSCERYEVWDDKKNTYNNPRIFVKNIMTTASETLTPNNYEDNEIYKYFQSPGKNTSLIYNKIDLDNGYNSLENSITWRNTKTDEYYFYTYKDTISKTYSNKTINKINDSLVQSENVYFKYDNIKGKFGYMMSLPQNKIGLNSGYYGIGEYMYPSEIRKRINQETEFTTTSMSGEDFAGLLVIDSNGNNIMYLENTNQVPLTGNTICYSTPLVNSGKELFLLEVK